MTVFYLDVGTVETLSDPDRLADIPWDEEKKPGVVRCCLENGPYWDRQARNHLLQHVYILQLSWRLLVLRIEESDAVLAKLFYGVPGNVENWTPLTGGDISSTPMLPWPVSRDWSGMRIPVRIPGNQEILSPCKLTLELLSPVHTPHTLHNTSLTSPFQGTWIVVLCEGTWERA